MLLQLEASVCHYYCLGSALQFLLAMHDCSDGHTMGVSETDDRLRALLESDKNG